MALPHAGGNPSGIWGRVVHICPFTWILHRDPLPVKNLLSLTSLCCGFLLSVVGAAEWRSSLYSEDWQPPHDVVGLDFVQDQFLQDYSYAGYRQGSQPLPTIAGPVFNAVTDYGADATGITDTTVALQSAIDAAEAVGGGVVYLPPGTYQVSRDPNTETCLRVESSGVVIRGAGADKTFLFNASTSMRNSRVIQFRPTAGGSWSLRESSTVLLTRDELGPTTELKLASVTAFKVGDWIIAHNPATSAFVQDLKMGPGSDSVNWENTLDGVRGPRNLRQIVSIDQNNSTITLDIPTRWFLKTRDGAAVYRATNFLHEVGIENLSLGNRSHGGTGWAEEDYNDSTKGAYGTHDSYLLEMRGVVDGWIRNVQSYNPGNPDGVHFLANGIVANWCRSLTVRGVIMTRAQYGGGGGNGYGIRLNSANECLVLESETSWVRHGFVFWHIDNSGNVITDCYDHDTGWQQAGGNPTVTSGLGSDHHGVFSHSNLIDRNRSARSYFEAAYRGDWGSNPAHGTTSSQTVFWNITGDAYHAKSAYVVHSEQFGHGYIIGTQGAASAVRLTEKRPGSSTRTAPVDFTEGIGSAATLFPSSLYRDQLARRLGAQADWLLKPFTVTQQPASQTIAAGQSATFTVMTSGTTTPTFQWLKNGNLIAGATDSSLTLTGISPSDNGMYSVRLNHDSGWIESRPAQLLVATPEVGHIVNESVLTQITSEASLTVGFTLAAGARTMLVRGIGPSLQPFVGDGYLPDPELALYDVSLGTSNLLQLNSAWSGESDVAATAQQVGAFPLGSMQDTALLRPLSPGGYTAILTAANGTAGTALLEIYATPDVSARPGNLINLSALRQLDDDSPSLTAGFVISGNVPKEVLLRAVGPSLEPWVGSAFLADPVLTVYRLSSGPPEIVLQQDDWQSEGSWQTTINRSAQVGAFPLKSDSTDAAIVLTLPAGNYTGEVKRKGTSSGVTLVEVYEVP